MRLTGEMPPSDMRCLQPPLRRTEYDSDLGYIEQRWPQTLLLTSNTSTLGKLTG